MKGLFLINGAISILIAIILIYGFVRHYKKQKINRATNLISLISLSYLTLALLSFLWLSGFFDYDARDFGIIYSVAIVFQTFILFRALQFFSPKKSLSYWIVIYVISLVLSAISFPNFFMFFLIASFFITLVFSINFMYLSEACRRGGNTLFFYSSISIILESLLFLNIGNQLLFTVIESTLFAFFAFVFLRDVRSYPLRFKEKTLLKRESHLTLFFRYFVFITVFTNFVLISTIGIHELSHVLVSRVYGCESRSIFYEAGKYPYSEIICSNANWKPQITLAGFLIPTFISVLLFLIGGNFVKSVAFLAAGFNLLASYRDFKELGLSGNLILFTSVVGIILLFVGVFLLAKSRMHEHTHDIDLYLNP